MLPDEFSLSDVSRETINRLHIYAEMLKTWTSAINLISPSTVESIWQRHIEDSARLFLYVKHARAVTDLGAGGGLPSVVLAILGCKSVHAIESDARKCMFLHECRRVLGLDDVLTIHHGRMEFVAPNASDAIVSRACAPLDDLLAYAHRHMSNDGRCFFLKGKQVQHEINLASSWLFDYTLHPSIMGSQGVVLEIYHLEKAA
jgi:16S rRNA (guanine527-N7)-methyltransferase